MNASTAKPWNDAPTERQNPNGMPGSVSVYSIRTFGIVVGQVRRAVERDEIDAVRRQPADALHQRLLHEALLEHRRRAGGVERAPHPRVADRTVVVVLDVVLAGPHDLHRLADGLRRLHGVDDEVGLAAAAEPAAHIGGVNLHLVGRQPRRARSRPGATPSGPASARRRRSRPRARRPCSSSAPCTRAPGTARRSSALERLSAAPPPRAPGRRCRRCAPPCPAAAPARRTAS